MRGMISLLHRRLPWKFYNFKKRIALALNRRMEFYKKWSEPCAVYTRHIRAVRKLDFNWNFFFNFTYFLSCDPQIHKNVDQKVPCGIGPILLRLTHFEPVKPSANFRTLFRQQCNFHSITNLSFDCTIPPKIDS